MTRISQQMANHLRQVYFGGNWTSVNFSRALTDVSWKQANTSVHNLNSIAKLVFHSSYYLQSILQILNHRPLSTKDELSHQIPPLQSQQDWEQLLQTIYEQARQAAGLIEQLPDEKLLSDFGDKKYGTFYRNINGIIEHMHYHLGQIMLIKKMLRGVTP